MTPVALGEAAAWASPSAVGRDWAGSSVAGGGGGLWQPRGSRPPQARCKTCTWKVGIASLLHLLKFTLSNLLDHL